MRLISSIGAILLLMVGCSPASGSDKVKLTLNWVPEPEFGGIYAAKETGAFARHNLDVAIVPGGAGTPTWQLVAAGKADYAVASADEVIIAREKGVDVVAIFTIYQTCPQGIMVHKSRGLKEIADVFRGGTLAVEPGLPYVNFLKQKYDFSKIKLVAYDGGIGTFVSDPKFAQQCFIFSEPIAARKAGADPQVFLVSDAGYNPYTGVVITTGKRLNQRQDEVRRVVQALRDGWRAYLDDPKPANAAMQKLNPDMDAATFAAAAEAQKPLVENDETQKNGLGSMTKDRWQTLIQQLVDLKVVKKAPMPEECFR